MSILSNIFSDVLVMLFPSRCAVCHRDLEDYERFLCIDCQGDMPTTNYHLNEGNKMAVRMRNLSPNVVNAASFLYLRSGTKWHRFFHRLKYYNGWRECRTIGLWYGRELAEVADYKGVDVVMPIPLHPLRRLKRGYNQSEYIARGIGHAMGVRVRTNLLRRVRNNSSQTKMGRVERWRNVTALFDMRSSLLSDSCHIMLVDDIFTTGATISTCIDAIVDRLPNAKITVVTIGVSAKQMKMNG